MLSTFSDSRRVLATLIRLLGDFDVAEKRCMTRSGSARAVPREGVPPIRAHGCVDRPFQGDDGIRRRSRFDALDDVREKADIAVDDPAVGVTKKASRTIAFA